MYDAVFVPTPKYVPPKWETTDLGEFVQYDPKFFKVVQIPEKQRMGLMCIRPKGEIPQPVGLTDYGYMFADSRIGSVDITGWNFSKVSSMAGFFMNCKRMDRVNCDGIDFRECIDFHRMFYNCDGLKEILIESWRLDEVSDCEEMFAECNKLHTCVISRWNTYKLDTTVAMFENCISLKHINCSGWITPDLNIANRMFKGCEKLKYANIRFTNVKGLMDMDRIFMDCVSLKEVVLPDFSEMPDVTLYLAFDGTPRNIWPPEYVEFMNKRAADKINNPVGDWGSA